MKKTISLLLALLMVFSLCACGSSSPKTASDGNSAYYSAAPMEMPATEADYDAEEADFGFSTAESKVAAANGSTEPSENPSKIIYSANVQVETTDFDASLEKLDELVQEYKGWVESSSINGNNYYDRSRGNVSRRSASYTLRIPSDRFSDLMSGLSVLGNIPYNHTYTENVTAQYYDVQARLSAYSAQEARLLEMMELAETVEDIITLEDRLTEVRYQIESLQSRLLNWDRQVSYSTVYLDLTEVQVYTPEPQVQPTFWQRLGTAAKDGLENVADFLEGLLFFLAESLPTLLVLAAIVALIVWIVKSIVRKSKDRKALRREKAEAAKKEEAAKE